MGFLLFQVLRKNGFRCLQRKNFNNPLKIYIQDSPISCFNYLNEKQDTATAKKATKVTLIGPNKSFAIVSLEEANNLSRRRGLELVKVQDLDNKTQRPVYKLITKAELFSQDTSELESLEEKKKIAVKKSEKNLTIGSKITDHDLTSRLNNIIKWLTKNHEVRILIQCSSDDQVNAEKIFAKIENEVKDKMHGKIIQKRVKGSHIKFSIIPLSTKDS